jgi:uncharacterized integral membrane protein
MQFLKTLFWVVAAVIAVVFALRNWTPVTINLWAGLQADIKLPVLVLGALLIGFLPPYALHRGTKWHMRRRIETMERNIAVQIPTAPEAQAPAAASLSTEA